ncbi:hypothetical protein V8C42DRAFT_86147 [Trichoderma barbatum]
MEGMTWKLGDSMTHRRHLNPRGPATVSLQPLDERRATAETCNQRPRHCQTSNPTRHPSTLQQPKTSEPLISYQWTSPCDSPDDLWRTRQPPPCSLLTDLNFNKLESASSKLGFFSFSLLFWFGNYFAGPVFSRTPPPACRLAFLFSLFFSFFPFLVSHFPVFSSSSSNADLA